MKWCPAHDPGAVDRRYALIIMDFTQQSITYTIQMLFDVSDDFFKDFHTPVLSLHDEFHLTKMSESSEHAFPLKTEKSWLH